MLTCAPSLPCLPLPRRYVGKRGGQPSTPQPQIDALLVRHAGAGRRVVRLKGGCPAVFSRVHSEMTALRAAGLEFELVPGVSSVLAAPLAAGACAPAGSRVSHDLQIAAHALLVVGSNRAASSPAHPCPPQASR